MRMHIGFSFKPKTLLIVLAVILGVVGACVDAYAAESDSDIPDWALVPALDPDEDTDRGYTTVYDMDGSVLYTDDPALEADDAAAPETPSGPVVINTAPAVEAAAPETYTYQRGDHTGLAASVQSIFGEYQPLMATDSAGNASVVPGLAGVDFCWVGGCLAFLILFYSFFRLLGGVFLGRSK
jgi:hypothetical protein